MPHNAGQFKDVVLVNTESTFGFSLTQIGSHEGTCGDVDLSTQYSVSQYHYIRYNSATKASFQEPRVSASANWKNLVFGRAGNSCHLDPMRETTDRNARECAIQIYFADTL